MWPELALTIQTFQLRGAKKFTVELIWSSQIMAASPAHNEGLLWCPSVWQLAPEWASEQSCNINHSWKAEESRMGVSQAVDQSRGLNQHKWPLPTLLMWRCLPRLRQSPAGGLTWSSARSRSKRPAKDTGKLRVSHTPPGSCWPYQSLWSKVLLPKLVANLIFKMVLVSSVDRLDKWQDSNDTGPQCSNRG